MRLFARFSIIGLLALSCSFDGIFGPLPDIGEPPPCTGPVGTNFALSPWVTDPLRLAPASAAHVEAIFPGCGQGPNPLSPFEIVWTVRDTTVVSATDVLSNSQQTLWGRFVVPRGPGRTHLVASARGHFDSLAITVLDTVPMGPVARIAAGNDLSCAVTEEHVAMCWGLVPPRPPSDSTIGYCMGTMCSPMPMPVKFDARSVHPGTSHACALDTDGFAWCWGATVGQPGKVSAGAFTALALGSGHTCGLTANAAALCWGNGPDGQLGNGTRSTTIAPVAVSGNHSWVSLASSGLMTCGATQSGELRCWGVLGEDGSTVPGASVCPYTVRDKNGAATTYKRPCAETPVRMPVERSSADSVFVEVSGTCARTASGTVFCHHPFKAAFEEKIGFGPFTAIAASAQHGCGLDAAGATWCWGANESGQLGDGSVTYRQLPVKLGTPQPFVQLAAGRAHTCGLTAARDVWCWGANYVGQAGSSILLQPRTPTRVRGQR